MSSSTIIPKDKPVRFLGWLYFRLKNLYKEEDLVLNRLADIVHNYTISNTSVSRSTIDLLCKKQFPQYELTGDYGFTPEFKQQLRELVVSTINYVGLEVSADHRNNNEKNYLI